MSYYVCTNPTSGTRIGEPSDPAAGYPGLNNSKPKKRRRSPNEPHPVAFQALHLGDNRLLAWCLMANKAFSHMAPTPSIDSSRRTDSTHARTDCVRRVRQPFTSGLPHSSAIDRPSKSLDLLVRQTNRWRACY
ncbi:uncharacterized protein PGTG_00938 [Puccinia graminis f. sp. tritici CRL 75-36-700-3]|uniref:Uncharacterized protein n=1 Tax=Puccinia graminis f. sp. tritici (strain CRL 75-36-700-3 / race SCCL) TaxID=418459 RepID=E3JU82_PUCGT|nr:uncharacterized protein PGTG_00938 [Puccinia graminis f. sp. tritici CRL 75-36-700-3]EFP75607.1 hypothetical protein PGTG_00938 [Puccinia graminis f. sp. tritici CRL 75-36-700-3]